MRLNQRSIVILAFTLVVGIIFGLVIASQLNFAPPANTQHMVLSEREDAVSTPPTEALDDSEIVVQGKGFAAVARRVIPAVVSITSERIARQGSSLPDFFHNWWGRDRETPREDQRQQGLGSGVIISHDGYVVTNYHVIDDADKVYVLMDAEKFEAEIIGTDPSTDLAVVRIHTGELALPYVKLGNSDALEVGEWVLAIGNPFSLRLQHTVTAGIVSGIGRADVGIGSIEYEDFIQTDAAINPGNSGGALVNLRGELVGLNTAIYSGGFASGNVGIGFAIPVNLVKYVTEELIRKGKVVRGWLGVSIQPVDSKQLAAAFGLSEPYGALVTDVQAGPAAKAGMKEQDVIVEFAGDRINDHNHLMRLVATHKPGESVAVKYIREGKLHTTNIVLGVRPDFQRATFSRVDEPSTLGLTVVDYSPELADKFEYDGKVGVFITEIRRGSEAEKEGLREGDVILAVNKIEIHSVSEFLKAIDGARRNGLALIHLQRKQQKFFVALDPRKTDD